MQIEIKSLRRIFLIFGFANSLGSFSVTLAVVVNGGSIGRPLGGVVGLLNGASAVPIGPRHVLTAKHVNPQANQLFYIQDPNESSGGFARYVSRVFRHPTADLSVVELKTTNGPLPYYVRLSTQIPVVGTNLRIGGWGYSAGTPIPNGYLWMLNQYGAFELGENWGLNTNVTASSDTTLKVVYGSGVSRATAARQDSGGGFFIQNAGVWELAGIITTATSGTTQPGTVYGASSTGLRIKNHISWIRSIAPQPPDVICPGDVNGDFKTNGRDLSVILANSQHSVTPFTNGDFNGDGLVNGPDLSVFLANNGCRE